MRTRFEAQEGAVEARASAPWRVRGPKLRSSPHQAPGQLVIRIGKSPNVIDKDGLDLFVLPFGAIEHDDRTGSQFLVHINWFPHEIWHVDSSERAREDGIAEPARDH